MKRAYLAVAILVILISANSAFCTYTIVDGTDVWRRDQNKWVDVIGDFIFEVYGIDVSWTSNKLIFEAYTNFDSDGEYPTPWSCSAYVADFFIDTDRNGTFEYGVVMKAHSAWTKCNIYPSDWVSSGSSSLGVGLYSVTGGYEPSNFWSNNFIYGQYYSNNPTGKPSDNDPKSYTAIKTGTSKGIAKVGVTPLNGSPQFKWSIEINRSALSNYDGKGMNIFWGGANCANDAIYGSASVPPIPEPGTLILLGSGLVGIASYGKFRLSRKKK